MVRLKRFALFLLYHCTLPHSLAKSMRIFYPEHSQKRALITGITGQDGSYLSELLLRKNYSVWGLLRYPCEENTRRKLLAGVLKHLTPWKERLKFSYGDLNSTKTLLKALEHIQPDEVYNLGAQSNVRASFESPEETAEVTGLGAARILESLRKLGMTATRFYQASSCELFGNASESPQCETTPFSPCSPYAAAKAYAFYMTRTYREAYGMFAVSGILFNHESPRRGTEFVTRKITQAAARIKLEQQETVQLGNLNAERDWGFAGDYVDAMWRMLQVDTPEDYVIASGQSHTVREFCELAFEKAGLPIAWEGEGIQERGFAADGRELIAINPAFYRPLDVNQHLGDATRAKKILGWQPQCSFSELVQQMVENDLALLQQKRTLSDTDKKAA